ncbi:flavodoxin [Paracoccus pantotrophus]|uniref:flavodoxin n=1 Tax=Paracoccus pantotrophus TaxID=82367 RepID=UPI0018CC62C8|nr:flavodoxin [Paracoccus pantotrophus]
MNRIRRALLQSVLVLPVTLVAGRGIGLGAAHAAGPGNLVVYFSRSGNTRVIAGQIGRAMQAEVFEIRPATPYPEDYEETVAQATRERESGYEPPLEASVENIAQYDRIWLGFPIWGGSVPPVIRSFLSTHDLSARRWSRSSPTAVTASATA